MAFIYDNLIATLISLTVLLILATIQMQATRSNTARTSRYIAKDEAETLSTWIEEDLSDMGKNMSGFNAAFENPVDSTDWHTKEFTFYYDSLKAGGGTVRIQTRYQLQKTGTRDVQGTTENVFKMTRERKVGGDPWQQDGESSSRLEYFEVNLLDKDATPMGSPTANLDQVEAVRVRFSVIAPFQNDRTVLHRVRRSISMPYIL